MRNPTQDHIKVFMIHQIKKFSQNWDLNNTGPMLCVYGYGIFKRPIGFIALKYWGVCYQLGLGSSRSVLHDFNIFPSVPRYEDWEVFIWCHLTNLGACIDNWSVVSLNHFGMLFVLFYVDKVHNGPPISPISLPCDIFLHSLF